MQRLNVVVGSQIISHWKSRGCLTNCKNTFCQTLSNVLKWREQREITGEKHRNLEGAEGLWLVAAKEKSWPFFPPHPFPSTVTPQDPAVQHPELIVLHWPKKLKVLPCCKDPVQGWAETQADSCSSAKFGSQRQSVPMWQAPGYAGCHSKATMVSCFPSNPQYVWGQFDLPNSLDWKRAGNMGYSSKSPGLSSDQTHSKSEHNANTISEADMPCRPCSSAISAMCQ